MRPELLNKINECNDNIVNLNNMKITDDEILEIMKKFETDNLNITVLNLDNNILGDKSASVLAKHLKNFPQIETLSVQFNQIGKEGAIELFSIKKELNQLDIYFHGNKIFDQGEMADIERQALQENQLKM